jgi:hypothetical protein
MPSFEMLLFFFLGMAFGASLLDLIRSLLSDQLELSDYLDAFPLTEHHLDLMIQMYPNVPIVAKDSNANLMSGLWVKEFIEVYDFYSEGTSYRLSQLGECVCYHHKKMREASFQIRS